MATRTLRAIKDTVRRQQSGDTKQSDGGGEQHLLAGEISGGTYTSLVQFDMDWTGVAKITSAYLHLITKRDTPHQPYQPYDESGILISRLAAAFSDPNNSEPENKFSSVAYTPASKDTTSATQGVTQREGDFDNRIPIHSLMNMIAPTSVRATTGQPGGGLAHHGFMIERRTTTAFPNPRMLVGSSKHPDTTSRPYIELNYDGVAAANSVGLIDPVGNINGVYEKSFTGLFLPGSGQPASVAPARWNIELRRQGETVNVWTYDAAATASDVQSLTFNIPLSLVETTGSRHKLASGTDYEWRMRAQDNKGVWTDWSHWRAFKLITNAPVLYTLRPQLDPPLDTLNNVFFMADFFDPDGNPVREFQVQVRSQTDPANPDWADDLAWDSGPILGQGSAPSEQTEGSAPEFVPPVTGGFQIKDTETHDVSIQGTNIVFGNEFIVPKTGHVHALRYYKTPYTTPTPRRMRLYDDQGNLLTTAPPSVETMDGGWTEVELPTPIFVFGDYGSLTVALDSNSLPYVGGDNPPEMRESAPLIWRGGRHGLNQFPEGEDGSNRHYFTDIKFVVQGQGEIAPPPPIKPPNSSQLRVPYGGIGLDAGVYSWRMQAWDSLDAPTGWYYAEFLLTKGFETDPGETDLLTGYAQRKLKARVLIKGMRNLLQTIDIVGAPTGGGYKLTFGPHTTPSIIPYNATPVTVQERLEALSTIAPGDVTVTGTVGHYRVVFGGNWAGKNVPKMTAEGYTFTPSSVYVNVLGDGVPGYNVAVIEDAANIGASEMYNSGGEFFFSLPAIHPQVAVIEPYQVHYLLEHYRGESWRSITGGIITDFDATDNDVVFYGQDYLAILSRLVDDRFNPTASADAEAVLYPATGGGAKYVGRTISQIITDQLDRAIHNVGSPLRFFTRGAVATMDEKIDIFVSFKERLPFIAGLIESHRAGTGVRTRLIAQRAGNGAWSFIVKEDAGRDRPNLRMEYGGLVQGFRVIPFGDFATRLLAVGRVYNQLKVEYITATAPPPSGQDASWYEENYGVLPKTAIYQDVTDVNDLKRRAKQAVARSVRVGKALALHLRPGALQIKDGWDIADSILVDINRGVVSTTRMGSGYWTIWGWTWELKPDGEEDITLSLLPKEDGSAPSLDLIPAAPIASDKGDWQIEARDPDDELDVSVFTHVNSNTGHIFQRDTTNGGWVDRTANLPYNPAIVIDGSVGPPRFQPDYGPVFIGGELPPVPSPNFPPGSLASLPSGEIWTVNSVGNSWEEYVPAVLPPVDTIPPDSPLIRALVTQAAQQNDGTTNVLVLVTVGYDTNPGYDDLDQYIVEITRASVGGLPDWTLAAVWAAPSDDVTGEANEIITIPGLLPATTYWLRAAARDRTGNRSAWSAVSPLLSAADLSGPPVPKGIVLAAGHSTIGVRWEPVSVLDLDYVEVGWRVAPAGAWTSARVPGTLTVLTGLTNDTTYDVRLRSVDTSGNVLRDTGADDASGNPIYETIKVASDPNAGWVSAGQATPSPIPGNTLVWDSAMIADIFAGEINADWITAGTLRVGGGAGNAAAISVFDPTGRPIGRWSTAGLEVLDPDNPGYKLVIDEASLSVYSAADTPTPYRAVSLTPLGIDAASITFGSARGGHNLVQNSSFELGRWGAVATTPRTWTVAADWNATRLGSDINITTGANDLTMTTV